MTTKTWRFIAALLLCMLTEPARTEQTPSDRYSEIAGLAPVPSYTVKRRSERINVDGKLAEAAWKKAESILLIFPWEQQTGVKQRTTVKLLYDQNYLYVGYDCADVDITAIYENRDDPVYRDDCVEIFLRPEGPSESYFGLEMNARGVLYDYFYAFPQPHDKSPDLAGVLLKTALRGTLNRGDDQDQGWSLELALPWRSLRQVAEQLPPAAGAQWRVQLNRWDGTEAKGRRLSMWCHSGLQRAHPHNPLRFGRVFFATR